ncbi:hypothetical protein MC885_015755 [Smutsia gigantea]|nr:hypothetical protein MC885_015755 [Smutsia gigantea]
MAESSERPLLVGLQFGWENGDQLANWTGLFNVTDDPAVQSGSDSSSSVGAASAFFKMVGQLLGAALQGFHRPNDTGKRSAEGKYITPINNSLCLEYMRSLVVLFTY